MNTGHFRTAGLSELFKDETRFLLTAHRGASYEYPENTMIAMRKAFEAGADFIEFDLRASADHVPVLLHDSTIDRTSDGKGRPEELSLAELKRFNFSYYAHFGRLEKPLYERLEIPTFEEVLGEFGNSICMNIQIYLDDDIALVEACRLFRKYNMYDYGYFTVTPDRIARIREIDADIELCVTPGWLERCSPENLDLCLRHRSRFIQPVREACDEKTFAEIRVRGLRGNVFMSDDPEETMRLVSIGAKGILTNKIEEQCRLRETEIAGKMSLSPRR